MNTSNQSLSESSYYILLSLTKPLHGYGIMQKVAALSSGRLVLAAGTLYGAITNMVKKGWIVPCEGRDDESKKEYVISETGMEILKDELVRLKELIRNGETIIK